ncbi:DUF547 domain-containing protein [Anaerolineales bacterium]
MDNDLQTIPLSRLMSLVHKLYRIDPTQVLNNTQSDFNSHSQYYVENIDQILRQHFLRIKQTAINEEGTSVNYREIAATELFQLLEKDTQQLRYFNLNLLDTDAKKKAFWINLYNILMIHGIIAYHIEQSITELKGAFEKIAYNIGGFRFSLDDIEHGILRSNRGLIWFPTRRFTHSDPRQEFIIKEFDPRIHFALVCASTSCPPISIYDPSKIETQLDLAASAFLNQSLCLHQATATIFLSKIFQWYASDFGANWLALGQRKALVDFIKPYISDIEQREYLENNMTKIKIKFFKYDWTLNGEPTAKPY